MIPRLCSAPALCSADSADAHAPRRRRSNRETGEQAGTLPFPRRREHGQFRCGYDAHACASVPTRSLTDLTPPPILVCPPVRAAARSPPASRFPSAPRWPRRAAVGSTRTAEPRGHRDRLRARCQTARCQLRRRCSYVRVWACTAIAQTVTALLVSLSDQWLGRCCALAFRLAPVFPSKPRPRFTPPQPHVRTARPIESGGGSASLRAGAWQGGT